MGLSKKICNRKSIHAGFAVGAPVRRRARSTPDVPRASRERGPPLARCVGACCCFISSWVTASSALRALHEWPFARGIEAICMQREGTRAGDQREQDRTRERAESEVERERERERETSPAPGNDKLDWANVDKDVTIGGAMSGTSTVLAIIANRFNFCFNLKGPSYVCDTACSASLTSTHCAKLMLKERSYDPLEWFLSMGAHLVLNAIAGVISGTQSHMGGPIGRCLTFNSSASGYLRGEGAGSVMPRTST